MLFNEPKLLKRRKPHIVLKSVAGFSALQRAEIAESVDRARAEALLYSFSALQRAEIAEIATSIVSSRKCSVSVLFNEPKLLKAARGAEVLFDV